MRRDIFLRMRTRLYYIAPPNGVANVRIPSVFAGVSYPRSALLPPPRPQEKEGKGSATPDDQRQTETVEGWNSIFGAM